MPLDIQDSPDVYPVEVKAVFSGDDLIVMADLRREDLWVRKRVRLVGVDTPNAVNAADSSEAGRVRKMVRDLVYNRRGVFTITSRVNRSWVGRLVVEAGPEHGGVLDLNQYLIDKGYVYRSPVARPEKT